MPADVVVYAFGHHPGSSKTLGDQWLLAVFLVVMATYLFLVSRTRVSVTDGAATFVVRNVLRTHRIPWSDVDSITERRAFSSGGAGGSFVIKVRLRDGRSIRCTALGGAGTRPLALQRELQSLRPRESTGAGLPGSPSGERGFGA